MEDIRTKTKAFLLSAKRPHASMSEEKITQVVGAERTALSLLEIHRCNDASASTCGQQL